MQSISTGLSAGVDAFRIGPVPPEWTTQQFRYMERWAMFSGSLFEDMARHNPYAADPSIYANTKLLWKHHEAVGDFYTGVIYQGSLSTDGKALPDGTLGAVPLDPQTPTKGRDELLLTAVAELWAAWNWQQQMSLRPMYGAILGDCLTELIDDTERRFVYPQVVWPGHVKDIELDYVGNVRRYVLEYRVQERKPDGTKGEAYLYRKEYDPEMFRHYRGDKLTSEIRNPYGFVPAVWDRHRIGAPGSVRGKSATEGTRQALLQLNSLLGHAFDFQHKAFWVPVMLASANHGKATTPEVGLPPESGRELAESFRVRKVPADAQLLQPTFDLGKTLEMIQDIREGVLAENPEASFYQQMREMQQVTAPGAERLMGDVKNRVDLARAGYDAGSVKLFQMAISMCGFRARDTAAEGWARRDAPPLNRRRLAFTQFDLQSFDRGELDMSILARPIVPPTEQERMETQMLKLQVIGATEGLQTWQGLMEALPELTEEEAKARIAERQERYALTLNGGDFGQDYEGETEGEAA